MPLASLAKTRNMARMKHALLVALALAPLAFIAPPAQAQERVLQVFGNDPCPANTICVYGKESDRYRIPKDLRGPSQAPEAKSWAARSQATINTGSTSPSACQSASNGTWTGCFIQDMRRARAEAKAKKEAASDVP
ncbi:MAG: hypothetical protein RL367_2855 [Pseudomonadota bacterium]|jgi:hypothetical protein